MEQIIGYCIRNCNECEIFKVTQADDDQKRAVMADDFSEMFDQNFKPEDINCIASQLHHTCAYVEYHKFFRAQETVNILH